MKKLVLIHGALGSPKEFEQVTLLLTSAYEVFNYCIPGHDQMDAKKFHFDAFAQDLSEFLAKIGPAYIFGFSMGGYIALHAASQNSENILGIVTLGTKFDWNAAIAQKESAILTINFLQEKAHPFYQHLADLHQSRLDKLLKDTADLMLDLGRSPRISNQTVKNLAIPIYILRGGKDRMVSQEESIQIAHHCQKGNYREIPYLPHPLFLISPKDMARLIKTHVQALEFEVVETSAGPINFLRIDAPENKRDFSCLFLHEALGSIAQWEDFPVQLCRELGTNGIILEMPGYGFSQQPMGNRDSRYLHHYGLEVLQSFRTQLAHEKPLLLIGHSDGGTEALLHAHKHPSQLVGVVTLAAHIRNEKETKSGIPPAIAAYEAGKLNALQIYHAEKTDDVFNAWSQTWLADFFKDWDITGDIQYLNIPGLILQGEIDQYGTQQQVFEIAKCFNAPVETCIIADCGHAPHLEKTITTIEAIAKWSIKLTR
jgi:pimeloyl-ACP methyl ester carboxylesterase